MTERDKAILSDLKRFRVLDRNQLIALHFHDQKQPITTCNRVMNRLVLKGLAKCDKAARPYNYFHGESNMKLTSMKVPHFKSIADFYIELCQDAKPSVFEVEIKVSDKGGIEPDAFTIWHGTPFFIEIQRSLYTQKVMQAKINRYESYYLSQDWKALTNKFPLIWLLSDTVYTKIEAQNVRVFQSKDVQEFKIKYMQKK